jgi:hypothetical protein
MRIHGKHEGKQWYRDLKKGEQSVIGYVSYEGCNNHGYALTTCTPL